MNWLSILIVVAVAVALIALSGARAKGTRPVGRTGLMTAARIVAVILAAVVAYVAWGR